MGDDQNKNRINSICIISISFLYFTELVMNQFGLNNSVLVYTIRDASSFFTLISVSFLIDSIRQKPRPVWQIIGNSFNIVLINRLYSNHMWLSVFQYIIGLDKQLLIGSAVAVFFIGLFVFFIVSEKHKKRAELPAENNQNASPRENAKAETVVPNPAEHNSPAAQAPLSTPSAAPAQRKQPASPNEHPIISFITQFIVVFAIVLFMIQHTEQGKMLLPASIEPIIPYFYFTAIASVVFFVLIIIQKSTPQFLTLIAFFITIFLFINVNIFGGKDESFSSFVLNAFANNFFAAVIGGIILFILIDLSLKIVWHFISTILKTKDESNVEDTDEDGNDGTAKAKVKRNKDFAEILTDNLTQIEKDMVDIACNTLKNSVSLFDFIPDFFEDISVILLGHEEDNEDDEK